MIWKIFLLYLCFIISNIFGAGIIGRKQTVGVRGILKCNGVPAKGVKVKLYDVDSFDIDDLMGEVKTDNNGRFEIQGTHKEITTIGKNKILYIIC